MRCTKPSTFARAKMSSAVGGVPWPARGDGDSDAGRRSALLLASYPVLLLLVIVAAFVKYVWIALTLYCALLFLLSCTSRRFSRPGGTTHGAAQEVLGAVDRGGLSEAAKAAISAFVYDASVGGEAQCAVCLETVRGGETVRRLPVCAHTFHVGCIDMWFDSHATCPVCRCSVEPQKDGKEAPAPLERPLPPV